MSDQQADKSQIGLSEDADVMIKEITESADFNQEQDVYRLAIALALAEGLDPAPASRSYKTKFAVGNLDPDHTLRSSTEFLRSDCEGRPQAMMERLAESGVERLHAHITEGKSLHELLSKHVLAGEAAPE